MSFDDVDWLERNIRASVPIGPVRSLTDEQRRCVRVLAAGLGNIYNLPTPLAVVESIDLCHPIGVSVLLVGTMSTTDDDRLTRLVLAAHREHVRVQLGPWVAHHDERRTAAICESYEREHDIEVDPDTVGAGVMELWLHARQPEGDTYRRHPGLPDLAASIVRAAA